MSFGVTGGVGVQSVLLKFPQAILAELLGEKENEGKKKKLIKGKVKNFKM